MGALSTSYPDAKQIFDESGRLRQIHRLIAKVPTIAAYAFRRGIGWPYVYPDNDLSFSANFLNMMFRMTEARFHANPVLTRALDVLFILHADHEQNCSTAAMRAIGSSHVDPYSALAGAAAALYGPLHGGANEAVLRMLNEIGTIDKVLSSSSGEIREGHNRLMVSAIASTSHDPRAKVIKRIADSVFDVTGKNRCSKSLSSSSGSRCRTITVTRKLYPNVDFIPPITRHGAAGRDVSGASPSCGPRAGSRSGRRCCSIRAEDARPRQIIPAR